MARITITEPEQYIFSTELDIYIAHINRADHLGNEHLVALMNEARCRFFASRNINQILGDDVNLINADLAVEYRAEGKYGDRIKIDIGIGDRSRYGCDFIYRLSNAANNATIAIAKTAMLTFDYKLKQLCPSPEQYWQALEA